jgi:hypothetical protein
LLENHSYPAPDWAAALLAAHRGAWAGVGPRVENANPLSSVSRAGFWLAYASMSGPQEAGVRTILPWHNTAYKRELITSFGERLPDLLDVEGVLQAELIAAGRELFLEPAAVIHHVNVSKFSSGLELLFQRGRHLGGWNSKRRRMAPWQRGLAAL